MQQKTQTSLAIFMFILVLLGNTVIFSIVPALSVEGMLEVRGAYSAALGFTPTTQVLHAFQILFTYSAIATLCMLPWALRQGRDLTEVENAFHPAFR